MGTTAILIALTNRHVAALALIALLAAPAASVAQPQPQPQPQPQQEQGQLNPWNPVGRPGIGVDARGGQVIDPTKNVLDLVGAAIQRQDDLRAAEGRYQDALRTAQSRFESAMREADTHRLADLRDADTRRLNELREAETRRINELGAQKQVFDLELARVIRAGLDASTLLLATQLKEVKTDASDRMAKLEQFANEQRGRASASDPERIKMLEEVRTLIASRADLAGRSTGQGELIAWVFAGLMFLIAAGGLAVNFARHRTPAHP